MKFILHILHVHLTVTLSRLTLSVLRLHTNNCLNNLLGFQVYCVNFDLVSSSAFYTTSFTLTLCLLPAQCSWSTLLG